MHNNPLCVCLHRQKQMGPPPHFTSLQCIAVWETEAETQETFVKDPHITVVVDYEFCFCPCFGRGWSLSQVLDRAEHSCNNSTKTWTSRNLPECPKCYLCFPIPCSIQVVRNLDFLYYKEIKAILWDADNCELWKVKWRLVASHLKEWKRDRKSWKSGCILWSWCSTSDAHNDKYAQGRLLC